MLPMVRESTTYDTYASDDPESMQIDDFDAIMELTREEKKELLSMWKEALLCIRAAKS